MYVYLETVLIDPAIPVSFFILIAVLLHVHNMYYLFLGWQNRNQQRLRICVICQQRCLVINSKSFWPWTGRCKGWFQAWAYSYTCMELMLYFVQKISRLSPVTCLWWQPEHNGHFWELLVCIAHFLTSAHIGDLATAYNKWSFNLD